MTRADLEIVRNVARHCYAAEPEIQALSQFNNAVFRLRFGDNCKVLKLAKPGDNRRIPIELKLIEWIGPLGIPVPAIEHADREGTLVGRPFFIMTSAGETTLANYLGKSGEVTARLFSDMGVILARIHAIECPSSGNFHSDGIVSGDPQKFLDDLSAPAEWLITNRMLDAHEVSLFCSLRLQPSNETQLCHGDYHAVQCIVRDNCITAIVDWESARSGAAILDLAVTHGYLDFYANSVLTQSFFGGYESAGSLPANYDSVSLIARMALMLTLLRVWREKGDLSWQYAVKHGKVSRAVELFRSYAKRIGK